MRWPPGARSVLVLGLAHPASAPELDWWGGLGGTAGNRVLQKISAALKRWLEDELQMDTWSLPYHVERGGIFLKDAAVLAGLGVLGVNNLVITPRWGPRVRWRALLLDLEPPESPESPDATPAFDPCADCARPCVTACPQQALAGGRYNLHLCSRQMQLDEAAAGPGDGGSGSGALPVKYCRACELACLVGLAGD